HPCRLSGDCMPRIAIKTTLSLAYTAFATINHFNLYYERNLHLHVSKILSHITTAMIFSHLLYKNLKNFILLIEMQI
ncbi:hypothetical protein, partial [Candidatus Liberibacter sp.]|uniref:hypothetical protein n=1 Tax=Candidatus Liberibacter sp. TaxID=34022 RepID=UPI001C70B513